MCKYVQIWHFTNPNLWALAREGPWLLMCLVRLRGVWSNPWGFKSPSGHTRVTEVLKITRK